MYRFVPALCAAAAFAAFPNVSFAQVNSTLPPVVVQAEKPHPARVAQPGPSRASRAAPRSRQPQQPVAASDPSGPAPSLTVANTQQAAKNIEQTPGAVAVVPDTAYKNAPAQTIKDILDYVPGVFAKPKWGDDHRLSIRGSGFS